MNDTACLLIHGVAGGRYQVKRLEEYLNNKGIHAESITVKGHEASRKELSDSKYYEWLADANQKYLNLAEQYRRVIVIGFSMGGLLTLNLAKRHKPTGFVLVNCPIYCVDIPNVCRKVARDFKERDFKNIRRYFSADNIPLKTLGELKKLLEHTKRQLMEIDAPALVLQCKDDDVVVPKSAAYIFDHIASEQKKLKHYEMGGHHIFTENENAEIYADVEDFVLEITRETFIK